MGTGLRVSARGCSEKMAAMATDTSARYALAMGKRNLRNGDNCMSVARSCLGLLLQAVLVCSSLPYQTATHSQGVFRPVWRRCPELRSFDGMRMLLAQSQVTSFAQCGRLLLPSPRVKNDDPLAVGLQIGVRTAASFLSNLQSLCSVDKQNAPCASVDDDIQVLNGTAHSTKRLLGIWTSRCSAAAAKHHTAAAANITLKSAVRGQLQCLSLAERITTLSKSLAAGACRLLSAGMINVSDVSFEATSAACASIPEQLAYLKSAARRQTCIKVFVIDTRGTSQGLNALAYQLEARFAASTMQQRLESDINYLSSWQVESAICFALFHTESSENFTNQTTSRSEQPGTYSVQSQARKLCPHMCQQLKNSLEFLGKFLKIRSLPALSMVAYTTNQHCHRGSSSSFRRCFAVDSNFTLVVKHVSSAEQTFCLNLRCHPPLRETNNQDHLFPAIKEQASQLSTAALLVFPSAERLNTTSVLNCGLDCVPIAFTNAEGKALRVLRSILGTISVLMNVFAIVTFLLNTTKLWRLPSRLNVFYNIAFLIGPGSNLLLAYSQPKAVACHKDDTVHLDEPRSFNLCTVMAAKYFLGSYLMAGFGLAMCVEWYRMIGMLHKPMLLKKGDHTREWMYAGACFAASVLLVAIVMSQKVVRGVPSVRDCSLTPSGIFYYFCIPFTVVMLAMIPFLILGLPKLIRLHKGVRGYIHYLKSQMAASRKFAANSDSRRFLEMMISRIQLYIIVIISGQLIILPCYALIFTLEDDVTTALQKRLSCLLGSCKPSRCPSLFEMGPELVFIPDVYLAFNGIATAIWSLNYKSYWQRHVTRVNSLLPACLILRTCQKARGVYSHSTTDDEASIENRNQTISSGAETLPKAIPIHQTNELSIYSSGSKSMMTVLTAI